MPLKTAWDDPVRTRYNMCCVVPEMRRLTDSERLAWAYATLELAPSAPSKDVVRQYRRLAKRWHPDRYANDPQAEADASQRMRLINGAFEVIRPTLDRDQAAMASRSSRPRGATAAHAESSFGQRLSPEEIDAIVRSLRGSSMFEIAFRYAVRLGVLAAGWILFIMSFQPSGQSVWGAPMIFFAACSVVWAFIRYAW